MSIPPETARDCPRSRKADRLVQLGLAFFVSGYDDGVFHLQKILLLHFCQRCAHFEGGRLIVEHNGYECAHFSPLCARYRKSQSAPLTFGLTH
jgi:hypothetical protein